VPQYDYFLSRGILRFTFLAGHQRAYSSLTQENYKVEKGAEIPSDCCGGFHCRLLLGNFLFAGTFY
jgi:hypothetical protein